MPELKLKLCPFNPKARVDSTKLPSPASVLWPSLCECQTKKVQSYLIYLSLGQAQRTVDMCYYLHIHVYDVIFFLWQKLEKNTLKKEEFVPAYRLWGTVSHSHLELEGAGPIASTVSKQRWMLSSLDFSYLVWNDAAHIQAVNISMVSLNLVKITVVINHHTVNDFKGTASISLGVTCKF